MLFKDILRVEVELFGFCNRKCEWCPNSEFDRTENKEILSKSTFHRLLLDLKSNGFAMPVRETGFIRMTNSIISFNGYCEPMSNPSLISEYSMLVKDVFGTDVDVYFNTNGDYFTPENLQLLSGVDCIRIMDYDSKGRAYWKSKLEDVGASIVQRKKDRITAIHDVVDYISVNLDWESKPLEDRGGFFNTQKPMYIHGKKMGWAGAGLRDKPCIEPNYFITVSHTGAVMPCCHLRQDNIKHSAYVMGNINKDSIVDIYTSAKYVAFKNNVFNKDFSESCKHCHKERLWYTRGVDISRVNVEFEE